MSIAGYAVKEVIPSIHNYWTQNKPLINAQQCANNFAKSQSEFEAKLLQQFLEVALSKINTLKNQQEIATLQNIYRTVRSCKHTNENLEKATSKKLIELLQANNDPQKNKSNNLKTITV